jgi:SAM-dependent methyltransferase
MKSLGELLTPTVSCVICDEKTTTFDKVEFSKNCEERRETVFPPTGLLIDYHRCNNCGHIHAPIFNNWTEQDFSDHIYNEQYIIADPEYLTIRPSHNVKEINRIFGPVKSQIKHLDYGGGDGFVSDALNQDGWSSVTYDPFGKTNRIIPNTKFNFITAFEVFEHTPSPKKTMENIVNLLDDNGILMFTTGLTDNEVNDDSKLRWWYISPRNGHVTIYSSKSLTLLAQQFDLNIHFNFHGMVLMYKNLPNWLTN